MTVKEILTIELVRHDKIYLFREGLFYRAYNRSTMRVVTGIIWIVIVSLKVRLSLIGGSEQEPKSLKVVKNKKTKSMKSKILHFVMAFCFLGSLPVKTFALRKLQRFLKYIKLVFKSNLYIIMQSNTNA